MKRFVLDSFAVLAYCQNEAGAKSVAPLLAEAVAGRASVWICVVNWGECYYVILRKGGQSYADAFLATFGKYPVTIVDADAALTLDAARFKARNKMSYADAFAAALAKLQNATLVTGDPEFRPLEKEIGIRWI
ncbi:MAG: PIN domain-containing protein [Phycisphaerae bacterium]